MTVLTLDAVSASFWRGPTEIAVLKDLSMEVRGGELFAVYGRRGAGKTTLLEIAAGLASPAAGTVSFDGRDLASLSRKELAQLHRNRIGWVERGGPRIADLPMRVYVGLPLYRELGHGEAQRRAGAALERVGAGEYADQCWSDLPDSARVLVAIAHALVREPRLLIVDDPTYGLGIVERESVVGLLRSAAEEGGVGVLMAAPEMPAMLHAHQVRSLSRGRLIAPPEPDEGGSVVRFPRIRRPA